MKSGFFALLCMVLPVVGYAAGGDVDWGTDFETARKLARETNRPIFANFTGSDWCGWCIRLDREVFDEPAFQSYAKTNLVLLMLDFPRRKPLADAVKKQNDSLMKRYGVQGFPTILLLDAEGKELARTGYRQGGADAYVEYLKKLLQAAPRPAVQRTAP